MKSSSEGLFVADKKIDEESIFDKFKRQTLLNGLKEDLINRVRFKEQSPITFILGYLCRKKEAVRKMKIYKRSDDKIKADIVIIVFIFAYFVFFMCSFFTGLSLCDFIFVQSHF